MGRACRCFRRKPARLQRSGRRFPEASRCGRAPKAICPHRKRPAAIMASIAVKFWFWKRNGLESPSTPPGGRSQPGRIFRALPPGAFSLADTARLLRRAARRQSAVPVGERHDRPSAPISNSRRGRRCRRWGGVCVVATTMPWPSGDFRHSDALARAGKIAKAKGIKRALPLAVSAPFHCP